MDYNISNEHRNKILQLLAKNGIRPQSDPALQVNTPYKFFAYESNAECWIYITNQAKHLVFFGNLITGINYAYRLASSVTSAYEWLTLIKTREQARRHRELLKGNKSSISQGHNVWATSAGVI